MRGICILIGALAIAAGAQTPTPHYLPIDRNGGVMASVNTQINVMMYGCKGDGVTDDHACIMNAQAAALGFASTITGPAVLYFPKTATGACYLTSTITWQGVSLIGQPAGLSSSFGSGACIQGKPGQDILRPVDPSVTANTPFYLSWVIRDLTLKLDDTSAGTFTNRYPGRWVNDAGMTSGSAILFTNNARIGCGDVGQAIRVTGAGTAGANLITTIASVSPCWLPSNSSLVQVTLATTAATTVSNAAAYISINGYATTYTMGNAALAFDDNDGKSANWPAPLSGSGNLYPRLENVLISSVSGASRGQNGSVGIFTQGTWGPYGLHADFVNIQSVEWGVAQVCSVLNSIYQSCANDYQNWNHMKFSARNPWVSYNGLHNHLSDIQIAASYGFDFLALGNTVPGESAPDDLIVSNAGWEGGAANYGWRYEGNAGVFNSVTLASGGGQTAYFNGSDTVCNDCTWSALQIGGFDNHFEGTALLGALQGTTDLGFGNTAETGDISAYPQGLPPSLRYSLIPTAGHRVAGILGPDFLFDGRTVPYNHSDLLIRPEDVIQQSFGNPYSIFGGMDVNSSTGRYVLLGSTWLANFAQFQYTGAKDGQIKIGANFPLSSGTFYINAMCPTGSSFTPGVGYFNGSTFVSLVSQSQSCNTTYATYALRFPSTGLANGYALAFQSAANTARMAWAAFVPDTASMPLSATTGSIGGSALTAGTCATGTVTVAGATTGMVAAATPVTYPGAAYFWNAYVSASNTITVSVCTGLAAGGTPTASAYNVRVIP